MIGFAPEGIRIGDLICQLKKLDIAVILHKSSDPNQFQIVGRAANAYPSVLPLDPFRCHAFPGG
jgi:hypothetical protein